MMKYIYLAFIPFLTGCNNGKNESQESFIFLRPNHKFSAEILDKGLLKTDSVNYCYLYESGDTLISFQQDQKYEINSETWHFNLDSPDSLSIAKFIQKKADGEGMILTRIDDNYNYLECYAQKFYLKNHNFNHIIFDCQIYNNGEAGFRLSVGYQYLPEEKEL